MEYMKVSLNTKLEVAVEILAAKIALLSKQNFTVEDYEMRKLLKEREEMYKGNEDIMDKIIKEYGPEIKKGYEGV